MKEGIKMDKTSIMPMIEKKLKDEFCNMKLLDNPRISELEGIFLKLSERFGSILEDSGDGYYAPNLFNRAYYLLYMANILRVVQDGIEVELPEYKTDEYSKKEKLKYEMVPNKYLKRTQIIEEKDKIDEKIKVSVSLINEEGIELQRIVDIRKGNLADTKTAVYERTPGNPTVIRRTSDGRNDEVFYDMGSLLRIENIVANKENKIGKEEIKELTTEQKEKIIEDNKKSKYAQGISRMLGIAVTKPIDTSR